MIVLLAALHYSWLPFSRANSNIFFYGTFKKYTYSTVWMCSSMAFGKYNYSIVFFASFTGANTTVYF
jgi:hypothetical protein